MYCVFQICVIPGDVAGLLDLSVISKSEVLCNNYFCINDLSSDVANTQQRILQ